MQYNPDEHSLKCPKCGHGMSEVIYGDITVDRCSQCMGLWFDTGEADQLKARWMGDALDAGLSAEGKKWDSVEDIACPRCHKDMKKTFDPNQQHIWYETCSEHGMFMDAGEFTDYKHETLVDRFRGLIKGAR